jgi:type I restriction enzyme M protein
MPPVEPATTESIPEGYVVDFLTGKLVRDTAEEYVRQNIEKALVRQFKYAPSDCAPEYRIKVGSSRKYVDIVVFRAGEAHSQVDAWLLVETKKAGTSPFDKKEGISQLQSYMAAPIASMAMKQVDPIAIAKRTRAFRAAGYNPNTLANVAAMTA